MSDLLFTEDLIHSGSIMVAELKAIIGEMVERTGALKKQLFKDLDKCDDD